MVARAIHDANPRGQLVPIDCGSLVGTLMESELFGHVKGAFSGAAENKKGLVEAADGGTAFFDEIGDLPLDMQVKLLRLVQEREFRPVGLAAMAQGRSADHRRDASRPEGRSGRRPVPARPVLPAQRPADPAASAARSQGGHPAAGGSLHGERGRLPIPDVLRLFEAYDWPGNVRELKHCVERMVALRSEGALRVADMPSALQNHVQRHDCMHWPKSVRAARTGAADLPPAQVAAPVISIPDSEHQAISAALAATHGERARRRPC